jgi:hypothetical protein
VADATGQASPQQMNCVSKLGVLAHAQENKRNNTKIRGGNLVVEIQGWKRKARSDLAILGSGSVVVQGREPGWSTNCRSIVIPVKPGEEKAMC